MFTEYDLSKIDLYFTAVLNQNGAAATFAQVK